MPLTNGRSSLILLVLPVVAVCYLYKRFMKARFKPQSPGNSLAFVILLRNSCELTMEDFQHVCRQALGISPNTSTFLDKPEPSSPSFTPVKYGVKCNQGIIGVNFQASPYPIDPVKLVLANPGFDPNNTFFKHQSWLSVNWLASDKPQDDSQVLKWLAKVAAQYINDNALGIYYVPTNQIHDITPTTIALLKSNTPMQALTIESTDSHADVQTELAAARQQAHEQWDLFVMAFHKNNRANNFHVKAIFPLPYYDVEHLWIQVSQIHQTNLEGRFATPPQHLTNKIGDPTIVNLKDIEDWLYLEDKVLVGGFTIKAITATAEKQNSLLKAEHSNT